MNSYKKYLNNVDGGKIVPFESPFVPDIAPNQELRSSKNGLSNLGKAASMILLVLTMIIATPFVFCGFAMFIGSMFNSISVGILSGIIGLILFYIILGKIGRKIKK